MKQVLPFLKISIFVMWYSIKKTNYSFEIKKLKETDEQVEVYFTKLLSCEHKELDNKINQTFISDKGIISLPQCINCKEDDSVYGLYKLHIKLDNHYDYHIVPYFPLLLKSLVADMETILCGCPCPKCKDCVESEELLNLVFKTLLYFSVSGNYYNEKLAKALRCIGCDLNKEVVCLLLTEKIHGSYSNKRFLKKILAIFYLALYNTEVTKDCNKDYHYTLFNYAKIKHCFSELGVDFDCIDIAFKNEKPTTGDNWLHITNRSSLIITRKFFFETSPPFKDFENDPVDFIKITSLTLDEGLNNGVSTKASLQLDGVDVQVGQIISMVDIDDNKLVYTSRDTNRHGESNFTWEVVETKC